MANPNADQKKDFEKEEQRATQPSCESSPECCGWTSGKGEEEKYHEESEHWIERGAETPAGSIPVVRTKLGRQNIMGKVKVRFGIGRMSYKIKPGLYTVGNAGPASPVLVSANYKLSFDTLRSKLAGLNAWILVLDTKGINVWCAAGKGTFGTEELVHRIEDSGLSRVITHRTLILPQLGAPGVAAHEVTRRTRFKVIYGPVRAADIKNFLAAGMKATPEMRRVKFGLKDRFVLTALELTNPFKYLVVATAVFWIISLLGLHLFSWKGWYPYLGAILIGGFFVPVLLPWIPGRPFAWKGWLLGMMWAAFVDIYQGLIPLTPASWQPALVNFLLLPAISAFLAMGFTGSSTYTSLSGVLKEMRYAVPAILASASIGIVFLAIVLIRAL
ncbi:MAG: mercury methylation corrinoid protein HgcA [Candidatus Aminicenantes bacterium]|nr:mercury methylation corrinoid protein HgcA [Candidatus Aminicenantes bacterium]